jgi:cobalt-zinc-cadmium efflux system outer membrane protein
MKAERLVAPGAPVAAGARAALFRAGCASAPRDAGFDVAAALARERGGVELVWRRGGPEDAELDRRVAALLAEELDAERAVEIALLANRRLQATYAELGFAQADVLEAARIPNPVFHAELLFPHGGGRTELDLGIEQSFLELLFMPLKKRMAAEGFEAAKLRVTAAALALAGEVRASFVRMEGARARAELRSTSLDAAEASFELAQRLHAAGNVRDLDLDLERAQREEARLAVATAELEAIEAGEALARLVGLHGAGKALRTPGRLPELPADAGTTAGLESRAIDRSLKLAATRHDIERAGEGLGLADSTRLVPGLDLGAVAEREDHWEFGPTLALPLPLFSRNEAGRRRAAAELERLRETYLADAIELRSRVRTSAARVLALHARAAFLRDTVIPLRGSIVDGFQLEYNAMQEGAFRLIAARRDQIEAGAAYIGALTDYWVAAAELDTLLEGAEIAPGSGHPSLRTASMPSTAAPTDAH